VGDGYEILDELRAHGPLSISELTERCPGHSHYDILTILDTLQKRGEIVTQFGNLEHGTTRRVFGPPEQFVNDGE